MRYHFILQPTLTKFLITHLTKYELIAIDLLTLVKIFLQFLTFDNRATVNI